MIIEIWGINEDKKNARVIKAIFLGLNHLQKSFNKEVYSIPSISTSLLIGTHRVGWSDGAFGGNGKTVSTVWAESSPGGLKRCFTKQRVSWFPLAISRRLVAKNIRYFKPIKSGRTIRVGFFFFFWEVLGRFLG